MERRAFAMQVKDGMMNGKATVEWETRQLGIMDWITNDVDWMTGEWHPACRRLAWHKLTEKIDSKYKSKYKRATLWNYETNNSGGCSLVLRRNKLMVSPFLNMYTIYLFVDARLFFTKQCIREFEEKFSI